MSKNRLKIPKSTIAVKMEEAGLSPKKELIFFIVINILAIGIGVGLYIKARSLTTMLGAFLVLIPLDYLFLSRATRLLKKKSIILEREFIRIFSYVSIYLRNGIPVYSAIQKARDYASEEMLEKLNDLLTAIDSDKSVRPFLSFASLFPSLEIRQVLIALYKMVEEGESEAYLRQFSFLFASLSSEKRKEYLLSEENKLSTLSALPLIDSALTMGLITIGIVVIMSNLSGSL